MTGLTHSRFLVRLTAVALGLAVACGSAVDAPAPEAEESPLPCAESSPTGVYAETWTFSLTSTETCGGVSLLEVERLAVESPRQVGGSPASRSYS